MNPTPEQLDVLQNLEFAVAECWRRNRTMSDYVAQRAYEVAFQFYRAESRGHVPKPHGLTGLDLEAFTAVHGICESRLGRGPDPIGGQDGVEPTSLATLLDCLRQLTRSVERHTKSDGRQGYLRFIDKFVS